MVINAIKSDASADDVQNKGLVVIVIGNQSVLARLPQREN